MSGSITLGMVGARTVLIVACSRCDRAGKYFIDSLVKKHGAGMTKPLRKLSEIV
jgi:hypothetical protein